MASTSRSTSGRLLFPASGLIALCAFVHACGGGGGGGGGDAPPPVNPPPGSTSFTPTSTFPTNSATNVPRMPVVLVSFTDIVNAATANSTTVTLTQAGTPVAATVSYLACNNRVQLVPDAALASGATYTVTLTSGVMDDDGEALTATTFTFTTAASGDIVPPTFNVVPTAVPDTTEVDLSWTTATDDLAATGQIVYRVYESTSLVPCFDFSNPIMTSAPGALSITVAGRQPRTNYSYVVRAVDQGGNESTNTAPVTLTTLTSYLQNVYPIVATFCQACHVPPSGQAWTNSPQMTMDYSTSATVYDDWVGVASSWGQGNRVTAGNPAASFLYNKISSPTPAAGARMPLNAPELSAENIDIVFDWITEGALDN